ncbi:PREDICTED: uncharacterized protein LOC105455604 isoform X1 [Wasmannia auropunctata]|uniref:uncharacterized protein LOC105455604 isoform X1 n=1 Tax=Wasmannia auropunctata TaxID=64793 RepID=UPI0005EE950E|nr:PREDICTED: uncharacterized protein LOC105455604 isoform X1 [Wasmannia auropunctata]
MSDDSAPDSSTVDNEEEEERRVRRGKSGGAARRLKALFCCLKSQPYAAEGTVECDPDECDYVVEKLVVRRVPLALFAIPADLADNASRSTSSSALDGNARASVANATREASTRITTNEALRFGDERRDSVGESLGCRAKSSVWREGIPSKFKYLNWKESEYPCKNPLNVSRSRRLFAENISEATSSTRTDVSSRTTSSATVQDDVSTRDGPIHRGSSNPLFGFENERKSHAQKDEAARDASSGKERDKFLPGRNQKYIVSPFRVRRGTFDLAKPKDAIIDDLGVDGKSLSYIEESVEDESSESTENVKNRDLGKNTAVRWRITIKRQRANATLEHSEPCPSLEGKTHR